MGDSISLNNYIEQLQAIQNSNTYEATAYTLPRNTDAVEIEVDSNNRTINIPKNFSNAIVYNDHNSLSLVFKIPRYFDDVDFSEKTCVIPYINPNGKQNIGVGVPISVTSDYITIEWNITNDCTCGVGVLTFAISFYSINDDGYIDYQWSTIPTALSVLRGLELIDGVFDVISSTMYEEILSRITAHENSYPIAHADGSITFEKLDITLQELINSKGSDINDTEVARIAKGVLMGREINNHVLLTKENAEDMFFMFIELGIDMADPMVGGTIEVYDHYLTINEDVKFIYDNQEYIIENNAGYEYEHRIGFGFDNIGNNVYLYFDSNDNKALFSFDSYPPNENAICIGTLQEAETQSGRTEDDIELELVFNEDAFMSQADVDILKKIDTLDDRIEGLNDISERLNTKTDKITNCLLIDESEKDDFLKIDIDDATGKYIVFEVQGIDVIINDKLYTNNSGDATMFDISALGFATEIYLAVVHGLDMMEKYLTLHNDVPNHSFVDAYVHLGTAQWGWDNENLVATDFTFIWDENVNFLSNSKDNPIINLYGNSNNGNIDLSEYCTKSEMTVHVAQEVDVIALGLDTERTFRENSINEVKSDLDNCYTKLETDDKFATMDALIATHNTVGDLTSYLYSNVEPRLAGEIISREETDTEIINIINEIKGTVSTLENSIYTFEFSNTYNTEIRLPEVSNISFTFGDGEYTDDYTSGLSFDSGETPTSIDYTDSGILNWVGTDCTTADGLSIFQPSANTRYDIVFYFNGRQFIGLVNGFVPATGNVVSE